jgi:hypothetical protein
MLRALTLIAMLFAAPAAFAIDSGDIVVVSAKGEVRVSMGGADRDARAGLVLELPASLRTGRDGGVELRQGETTVSVGPDTVLEFPALEKRGAPIDRIQQPRGSAFYNIGKREGRKLRVETPYLVGVVKGTQFNVVAQDEATTISLFEGLLEVRATDESVVLDLKAGEIASRRRGGKTIDVVRMDGARSPDTAPRPQGNSGGDAPGNDAAASSGAPGSGDQPGAHEPLVSVDGSVHGTGGPVAVGVSTEIRALVGVNADTSGVDTAVNVAAVVGNVVDTSATVAVDLGHGAAAMDVTTSSGVDLGPVSANADTSANVDMGSAGAAVDVAASTSVDAGPVSVAVDTSAAVDLGSASLGADLTTSTGVDAGPVTASVDTGTTVDLGGNGVAVDVDAGAALGGAQTPIDVAAGVSVGADLSAGTVDLGVTIGGLDLDLGVNLGLDGNDPATDTGSSTTDTATDSGDTGIIDIGGLLDGLLRRPGRR